jgi:hypothetical protein
MQGGQESTCQEPRQESSFDQAYSECSQHQFDIKLALAQEYEANAEEERRKRYQASTQEAAEDTAYKLEGKTEADASSSAPPHVSVGEESCDADEGDFPNECDPPTNLQECLAEAGLMIDEEETYMSDFLESRAEADARQKGKGKGEGKKGGKGGGKGKQARGGPSRRERPPPTIDDEMYDSGRWVKTPRCLGCEFDDDSEHNTPCRVRWLTFQEWIDQYPGRKGGNELHNRTDPLCLTDHCARQETRCHLHPGGHPCSLPNTER